jgi:hypothetical protein
VLDEIRAQLGVGFPGEGKSRPREAGNAAASVGLTGNIVTYLLVRSRRRTSPRSTGRGRRLTTLTGTRDLRHAGRDPSALGGYHRKLGQVGLVPPRSTRGCEPSGLAISLTGEQRGLVWWGPPGPPPGPQEVGGVRSVDIDQCAALDD